MDPNLSFDVNVKMRRVAWNCLPVYYELHPRCSLTALNSLEFSGDLRSANKAAIMGVVLHSSIFLMLYMHSLRICFGSLDGKFFLFRLVVSIIFGSLVSKTKRQNSDKHIYLLKEDKKIKISQTSCKNWKQRVAAKFSALIYCP